MTIGIITNTYEFNRIQPLLEVFKNHPEVRVEVLTDEEHILSSECIHQDWNIGFTKGRGPLIQAQACYLENAGIPIHNCSYAIHVTNHRMWVSSLIQAAGVPQPAFAVGQEKEIDFSRYIRKNLSVEFDSKFVPEIRYRGTSPPDSGIYYFQEIIDTEWEYKVYSFGDKFMYFKQVPVMVNPDKMSTRCPIPENPILREYVQRIKAVTRLSITSVDFLKDGSNYYVTDVNSAPNFNHLPKGAELVAMWLVAETR